MKTKRSLSVITVAVAVLLTVVFAGCEKTKVRYTIENNASHVENVVIASESGALADGEGSYFYKGTPLTVTVYLEAGYGIGTVKLAINDEEQELVPMNGDDLNTAYKLKENYVTETERITVTLTGNAERQST